MKSMVCALRRRVPPLAPLALLALAGCVSRGLPENTVAVLTPLSLEPPPIYSLIGYRTELHLSSEQISALDSIGQQVREENRTLVEELRRASVERRNQAGAIVVVAEGRPILEAIRENQLEAVEAVEALLDEGQKETVCELIVRSNGRTPARGRSTRPPPERVERSETMEERVRLQQPIGWNWCSPGEEEGVTYSGSARPALGNRR